MLTFKHPSPFTISDTYRPTAVRIGQHSGGGSRVLVDALHIHPEGNQTYDGDLCLLRLAEPLELGREVLPVCLPDSRAPVDEFSTYDVCISTGWNWRLIYGKCEPITGPTKESTQNFNQVQEPNFVTGWMYGNPWRHSDVIEIFLFGWKFIAGPGKLHAIILDIDQVNRILLVLAQRHMFLFIIINLFCLLHYFSPHLKQLFPLDNNRKATWILRMLHNARVI